MSSVLAASRWVCHYDLLLLISNVCGSVRYASSSANSGHRRSPTIELPIAVPGSVRHYGEVGMHGIVVAVGM